MHLNCRGRNIEIVVRKRDSTPDRLTGIYIYFALNQAPATTRGARLDSKNMFSGFYSKPSYLA